ncbi:outer membrane protein assembly factor BamA [candidate division WOR-3 bacterium]|nr:outer membrane protein assembly factor BamA [candidate division WOR-3 bacterium]
MKMIILFLSFIPCVIRTEALNRIIVEGNDRASNDQVIQMAGISPGDEFSPFVSASVIKNLFSTDLFRDVSLDTFYDAIEGLTLVIEVEENPVLDTLIINGSGRISEANLREWLSRGSSDTAIVRGWPEAPFKGRTVTDRKLSIWKKFILDSYAGEGYIGTAVDISVSLPDDQNRIEVTVDIKEGRKITIAAINLNGLISLNSKIVKSRLQNREWGFYGWRGFKEFYWFGLFRKGGFNQNVFEGHDVESIERTLRSRGFPDAEVDSLNYIFNQESTLVVIEVFIDEGDKKYFGETVFEGNVFFETGHLEKYVSYDPGQPYDIEKIEKTQRLLSELYADSGFIYVQFNPVQTRKDSTVDITWQMREGPRVKIRLVEIMGNYRTRDRVIRREITQFPGEYFSISGLRLTSQKIFNLGFFDNIIPDIAPVDSSNDSIAYADLIIEVFEKKAGEIRGGATYSHYGGVGAYAKFAVPNLLGKGETFDLEFDINSKMWNFDIGYFEPWVLGTDWAAGARLFATTYEMDYYKYRKEGFQINTARALPWIDFTKIYNSYTLERVEVEIFDPDSASDYLKSQEGLKYISKLGITFVRDARDKYFNTSRGTYFSLATNLTGGFMQGDVNFREHVFEYKYFLPVTTKKPSSNIPSSSLMFRNKTGVISDFYSTGSGDVPVYELYRLGGIGEWGLRGYDEYSIGPVQEGDVIGGATAILLNAQYSVHLGEMANFSIFADAGNVWETPYSLEGSSGFNDLYKSAGLGFRINLPMLGIMGIDYAYGFSTGDWKPHVQFGTNF